MHHIFTPSGSDRWLNCFVSLSMERALGLPFNGEDEDAVCDDTSGANQFAAEGTLAHAVGEWCLNNNKTAYDCTRIVVDGQTHNITREMQDYVQIYVSHINKLIRPKTEYYVEKYNVLDWIDPDLGGTADFVGVTGNVLDIADLKYGMFHQVFADRNTQLMIYALGMIGPNNARGIKKVRLHIIQPRINEEPSVWETTIEEMDAFRVRVEAAVAAHRVRFNNGTLPTDLDEYNFGSHCKFCRALGVCKKADKEFLEEEEMSVEQLAKMSNEMLAERLERAKVFGRYVKSLEKDAKARLEKGEVVAGFELETTHRREWTDEWEVRRIAADNHIDVMTVKSPTDLAKDLGNQEVSKLFKDVISAKTVVKMVQR